MLRTIYNAAMKDIQTKKDTKFSIGLQFVNGGSWCCSLSYYKVTRDQQIKYYLKNLSLSSQSIKETGDTPLFQFLVATTNLHLKRGVKNPCQKPVTAYRHSF